jgi:anti-sigma B factor antagonist
MEIATHTINDTIIIDVKGRLDTTNYNTLEKDILNIIEKGNKKIIVNCQHLDYVSSSGLRVFLVALKKLKAINGKFALTNLQDNIKDIFEISGFITIFQVYPTTNEALAAMEQ